VHYGVSPDWSIDYEQVQQLAKQEGADIIVVGASAYPKKIEVRFREIADQLGARVIADISHYAGLIAGALTEPGANADIIVEYEQNVTWTKRRDYFLERSPMKTKTKVNRAVHVSSV